MNTGMAIATIFSLLLALATAGDATKHQAPVSDSTAIRGQNLNHNETLVRDSEFKTVGPANCPKWLCGGNHNETLICDTKFEAVGPTTCPKWICGSNHNEMLLRDKTPLLRADDWSLWLSGEQSFDAASLLIQFSFYRPLACPPIMCNHNETLVSDSATPQRQTIGVCGWAASSRSLLPRFLVSSCFTGSVAPVYRGSATTMRRW
ncbi:MAG: hypothetical protein ND895_13175 [Pyrinomonadaceae bacterium]|nr:hypothetical protein [Pyrinomonadaceae bacterium]